MTESDPCPPPSTTAIDLHLHYDHALGDLGPYFRGLAEGRAVAARCPACGRRWFPPRLVCPEDRAAIRWIELTGQGVVVTLTRGRARLPLAGADGDYTFALVSLDGAENLAFGRLADAGGGVDIGHRVRLAAAPGEWPHPAQAAHFVPERS